MDYFYSSVAEAGLVIVIIQIVISQLLYIAVNEINLIMWVFCFVTSLPDIWKEP